tara:strand:- start:85 stop:270 length:186 start_codon:yes stop_codon:yes gene_type:complete
LLTRLAGSIPAFGTKKAEMKISAFFMTWYNIGTTFCYFEGNIFIDVKFFYLFLNPMNLLSE